MTYAIGLAAVALLVFLYTKLKGILYQAKDKMLIKEDESLKLQQVKVEEQVNQLKDSISVSADPNLTPTEVENFWKDNKK